MDDTQIAVALVLAFFAGVLARAFCSYLRDVARTLIAAITHDKYEEL